MNNKRRKKLIVLSILAISIVAMILFPNFSYFNKKSVIRLGYFYGGRLDSLYEAKMKGYFSAEGLDVQLWTKRPFNDSLMKLPDDNTTFMNMVGSNPLIGRMNGIDISAHIMNGDLDGGGIGESSFIYSVQSQFPIIAVAELGHCAKDKPCRGIVVRKEVNITKPQDFIGKKVCFIREGSADDPLLKIFFQMNNISYDKDVTLVPVEDIGKFKLIENGQVDACLLHYYHIKTLMGENDDLYLYRGLDWVNPEISSAFLVFRKDFIYSHPVEVQKFMRAFNKFLNDEKSKKSEFLGLSEPVTDNPPLVRTELLDQMQLLMVKYNLLNRTVDLSGYINNSFVIGTEN